MDQDFDPYFELLGIPKTEQPANCYRLLGIPEYTSNKQVIANGAARQMQFLRRVGGDQYLDDVQKMLNEISKVRILLLDDNKRAEYDKNLKAKSGAVDSESGSVSGSKSQSEFDLLAPTKRGAARVAAIQLLHLSGPRVGQTISLHTRDIQIGPSKKSDVMLPTRNGSTFKMEHEIDQWILSSEDTSFAVNGRLVSGLATIKDGDILRFSAEGPDVQFIEEVDLNRHLETLGQYENVAKSSSSGIRASNSSARKTGSESTGTRQPNSSSQSGSRSVPTTSTQQPQRQGSPTRQPLVKATPVRRPKQQNTRQPQARESLLIKKPTSQKNQGLVGTAMSIANRALGRNQSFEKKTGASFDWQMCVFWLVVGSVLAAIAAGVILGWRI